MILMWLIKLLFQDPFSFLLAFILLIVPLLLSITIHEWAHGMVAYKFGDSTPKNQGRLTLNPFAHLDPIGTILLFIIGFGWAKPVQINPNNIGGKTKQLIVALAGPASNIIFAVIVSIILLVLNSNTLEFMNQSTNSLSAIISTLLSIVVKINIILAVFNMMPIPPLDGSSLIRWILPKQLSGLYNKIESFGFVILLILLFTIGFSFIFKIATQIELWMFKVLQNLLSIFFQGV